MINLLASIVVLLSGFYLVGLAVVAFVSPTWAARFLRGFATSAFTHRMELVLRLLAGLAIVLYAPQMLFPEFFTLFGWVLVLTALGLFAVPWHWHHRFAQRTVPYAIRNLRLVAIVSLVFGGFILAAGLLGGGPAG